jgi:hypothetical protein
MPRNFSVKPIQRPADRDIGWTAGIVDGEGAVSLYRTERSDGKHAYGVQVRVTNTDPRMLQKLQGFWGGVLRPRKGKLRPNCRQAWEWSLYGDQARELLRSTMEDLVTKREQAEIVLEYEGGYQFSGAPLPEEERMRRESIRERLTLLKGRGVAV